MQFVIFSVINKSNRPLEKAGFFHRNLTPRRRDRAELLDAPDVSKELLAGTFRDIRLINRWFGGVSLVERSLDPFLPTARPAQLNLLDVACGLADVPLALAQRWATRGIRLNIRAVDLNQTIVELAQEAARREGIENFEAVRADVFEYEWPASDRYDFVTCSLAFHHFQPAQCVEMLRLMSRLSRRAFVVNDLRRSWWGWAGAKLLTWTLTRHPLNRHDAPLSVLRAFTPAELADLAAQAELGPEVVIAIRRGPFSRLAIVGYHKDFQNLDFCA